jgi:hypothetical protein
VARGSTLNLAGAGISALATLALTVFAVVSPAFANPSEEAEGDYAGWLAAQRAAQHAQMPKGHVIFRSYHLGR